MSSVLDLIKNVCRIMSSNKTSNNKIIILPKPIKGLIFSYLPREKLAQIGIPTLLRLCGRAFIKDLFTNNSLIIMMSAKFEKGNFWLYGDMKKISIKFSFNYSEPDNENLMKNYAINYFNYWQINYNLFLDYIRTFLIAEYESLPTLCRIKYVYTKNSFIDVSRIAHNLISNDHTTNAKLLYEYTMR